MVIAKITWEHLHTLRCRCPRMPGDIINMAQPAPGKHQLTLDPDQKRHIWHGPKCLVVELCTCLTTELRLWVVHLMWLPFYLSARDELRSTGSWDFLGETEDVVNDSEEHPKHPEDFWCFKTSFWLWHTVVVCVLIIGYQIHFDRFRSLFFPLGLLARYLWLLMVFLPNWSVTRIFGANTSAQQNLLTAKNQRCSGWCFLLWIFFVFIRVGRLAKVPAGELRLRGPQTLILEQTKKPNENSFKKPLNLPFVWVNGTIWKEYSQLSGSSRKIMEPLWPVLLFAAVHVFIVFNVASVNSASVWIKEQWERWWDSPMTPPGK